MLLLYTQRTVRGPRVNVCGSHMATPSTMFSFTPNLFRRPKPKHASRDLFWLGSDRVVPRGLLKLTPSLCRLPRPLPCQGKVEEGDYAFHPSLRGSMVPERSRVFIFLCNMKLTIVSHLPYFINVFLHQTQMAL